MASRAPIERAGERRSPVAASPEIVAGHLADAAFVTAALDDLLDQTSSVIDPHVRWVLPRLHVGRLGFDVVLLPQWQRQDHVVTIDATAAPDSDVDLCLRLTTDVVTVGAGPSVLTIAWELGLVVPLPGPVLRAIRPALDRSIDRVVDRVVGRVVTSVEHT
jgi:hypothetical protein